MENRMDGLGAEHSDSDSGESWTLLDHNVNYAEDLPNSDNSAAPSGETTYVTEKDEDTDGISIISDSEPESITPCEQVNFEHVQVQEEENHPTEQTNHNYVSIVSDPPNNHDLHESIRCDDFLGDSTKLKTYVHRRNKKLSTVLNIIVLGSVITAAGVAIGHMWGVRDDCTQHTPSSVNKILSNLYKLQEENAYLRNKIREMTLAGNIHYQRKSDNEKPLAFKTKCRKVFEESLTNKNAAKSTKCVDPENNNKPILDNHLIQPVFEQEFLSDLDKLKTFYQQNKSWLDVEVARRLKDEELALKNMKNVIKMNKFSRQKNTKEDKEKQLQLNIEEAINEEKQLQLNIEEAINEEKQLQLNLEEAINEEKQLQLNIEEMENEKKRVSYADSLKSERDETMQYNEPKVYKRSLGLSDNKKNVHRKRGEVFQPQDSLSDDEIKKDNRYTGNKHKQERKKHDRHKSNKKLKLKNKYEQWEMKGGYMKDYDDISIISSQESLLAVDKNLNPELAAQLNNHGHNVNNIDDAKLNDNEQIYKKTAEKIVKRKRDKPEDKIKEDNWYEKRVALRREARKRLEQELFGENSPNNAGWYFRRMQKREQCRAKPDNSTFRKAAKRNMNFKTKH